MENTEIAIIVAMAKNRIIGKDGQIPWDLPEDREYFKKQTMGHVIVMGRRSYEEIGHPLPGRGMIVISQTLTGEEEHVKGCFVVPTMASAIDCAREHFPGKKIFLCGGARVYEEGMALAKQIYLTQIDKEMEGDTCFPPIGKEFVIQKEEQGEHCRFICYKKIGTVS